MMSLSVISVTSTFHSDETRSVAMMRSPAVEKDLCVNSLHIKNTWEVLMRRTSYYKCTL